MQSGAGAVTVACAISWNDGATYAYSGSMRLTSNADGTLSATFDGRRAQRSCVKKGGKRCFKNWDFSYKKL